MSFREGVTILIFTLVATLHAEAAPKTQAQAQHEAAKANQAAFYNEVIFEKSSSNLTSDARKKLSEMLEKARAAGEVESVKVIAWGDQELAPGQKQLNKDQRKLADDRSSEVKNFFTDSAPGVAIDTYNMAEASGPLEKLTRTNDEKIKRSLEQAGVAGMHKGKSPKASRVLVLVTLK